MSTTTFAINNATDLLLASVRSTGNHLLNDIKITLSVTSLQLDTNNISKRYLVSGGALVVGCG